MFKSGQEVWWLNMTHGRVHQVTIMHIHYCREHWKVESICVQPVAVHESNLFSTRKKAYEEGIKQLDKMRDELTFKLDRVLTSLNHLIETK